MNLGFGRALICATVRSFVVQEMAEMAVHQDLATAGKRAVRPPAVARSGGSEAFLRKSNM